LKIDADHAPDFSQGHSIDSNNNHRTQTAITIASLEDVTAIPQLFESVLIASGGQISIFLLSLLRPLKPSRVVVDPFLCLSNRADIPHNFLFSENSSNDNTTISEFKRWKLLFARSRPSRLYAEIEYRMEEDRKQIQNIPIADQCPRL
jgi:hypothetical protein